MSNLEVKGLKPEEPFAEKQELQSRLDKLERDLTATREKFAEINPTGHKLKPGASETHFLVANELLSQIKQIKQMTEDGYYEKNFNEFVDSIQLQSELLKEGRFINQNNELQKE